jgi:hypothetical protein
MNNHQFISYEKTPNDDLQLGIATVLVGDFIVRYRHMSKKDGSGQYFAPPSVSSKDENQQRKYHDGFEIDSRAKGELLMAFIRKNVLMALEQSKPHMPASVFAQATTPNDDQGVPF